MIMKTVVISGASQGLGQKVATTFVRHGWRVIGTGRSPRPDELDTAIEYHQFDASDASACASFWQEVSKNLDDSAVCLVNNAGGYVGGGLTDAKAEDFDKQMHSIYFTSVYMTKAMTSVVSKARVINVISAGALVHEPKALAYGAAKAAQRHFFQSLQKEFKTEQYQITNLYPSFIASHEPDPNAIDGTDLAEFIAQLAESRATYYLRDVTLYPATKQ